MKTITYFSLFSCLAINTMNAQSTPKDYIEKRIIGKETPGFQYIVKDSSGIRFEYFGGKSDSKSGGKVTKDTEFKMFSATKIVTSLAILQLVESGELGLYDDIGELLNIPFTEPVTVRRVLSHTAGLSPAPLISETHSAAKHADFNAKETARRIIAEHQKLSYKPGTKKKYSNLGYLLLGEVIEKVSGLKYTEYVQKNIFDRLGNEYNYSFAYNENTATGNQKTGNLMHFIYSRMKIINRYYTGKQDGFMTFENLYLNGYSYGGGFTTARGLAHFGQVLLQKNSSLLSNEYKEILFSEQLLSNGKSSKHCLGWFIKEANGVKYFSHPGGGGGYSCELRLYPESGMVSVYMMNTTQLFSHLKLLNKLDRYFLP